MARLRRFVAYRKLERPYTRRSRYKENSYIKSNPHIKVIAFETGSPNKKFEYTLNLISKQDLQIRDNALESAKQTSNRMLERNIGTGSYHLKIKTYPFHILRENPIAAGAGADRFSTGMQKSFGKPMGVAAQIKKGQTVFQVSVNKANLELAKTALKRASKKLPCSYMIGTNENML